MFVAHGGRVEPQLPVDVRGGGPRELKGRGARAAEEDAVTGDSG